MIAELIVIGSLGMVVYVYAGYPLLLWLLGRIKERKTKEETIAPSASMIIAVHNEESVLADKLENSLSLRYPAKQLEILVVSDGSTDDSETIAERYEKRGVRLLRLRRCGKLRALESAAEQARGEILVFTDANTWVAPHALQALVAHFADPDVGGVCGEKRVGRPPQAEAVAIGEGFYWKYEQFLKRWESRTGSTIAADGALYAIRRELFHGGSNPAQADDFAISARIPISGKRLVFETRAVVWEGPPASAKQEFLRKMRVTNHQIRSLWEIRRALNPFQTGLFAIKVWSHKLLRYVIPFPLAAAWILSLSLAGGSVFFSLMLGVQCAFYALALAGIALRHREAGRSPLVHAPFYFCLAHSAALIGAFSALRGKRIVAWNHGRTKTDPKIARVSIHDREYRRKTVAIFFAIILFAGFAEARDTLPSGDPLRQSEFVRLMLERSRILASLEENPLQEDAASLRARLKKIQQKLRDMSIAIPAPPAPLMGEVDRTDMPLPRPSPPSSEGKRFRFDVSISPSFSDNYFQAVNGTPRQSAWLTNVSSSFQVALVRKGYNQLMAGADIQRNHVEGIQHADWNSYGARLAYSTRRNQLMFQGLYIPRRLTFTARDGEAGFATTSGLGADFYRRLGKARMRLFYRWNEVLYPEFENRNAFSHVAAGDIQYQFHSFLGPGVGFEWTDTRASLENYSYSEKTPVVLLGARFGRVGALNLRYRYRERIYPIQDRLASNFGRKDRRHDAYMYLSMNLGDHLGLIVQGSYLQNISARASRGFKALSGGITLRYIYPGN